MHLIRTKSKVLKVPKCRLNLSWFFKKPKCSESKKSNFAPLEMTFYSSCSPWLVMSENPNLLSRKELSDLYLYIYAYQICFDLMIRTQGNVCFFTASAVDQKLTSSWALNWIWHEIRMLAEFFDKKISGFQIPPFFVPYLVGV